MIGPKGKFLLEPDDNRTHLYVSTGTGIAPFISMIRDTMLRGDRRKTVVLHGCSYTEELGYRDYLEGLERERSYPLTYVPTISRPREARNSGWSGRTGRAEAVLGPLLDELGIQPQATVAYVCGNPEMISSVDQLATERGFPPEQVRKELYWPKGRAH